MPAAGTDKVYLERGGIAGAEDLISVLKLVPIIQQLGGQFLLDPNEYNGWGTLGTFDNSNTQDLGNIGAAPARLAGGFSYPFDVKLVRFFAWHYNSNGGALPWGWRIVRQEKIASSSAVSFVNILDEVGANGGDGPRDYGNTQTQKTDLNLSAVDTIPAGEVIVLGVESPTAITSNNYVRILSGFFEFKRV